MPREIRITDDRQRDARVAMESVRARPARKMAGPGGADVTFTTFIKVPEKKDYAALLRAHGSDEALARALVAEDPERYWVPPYVGHKGWVAIVLDTRPDWRAVARLVQAGFATVASPARPSRPKRRS